MDLTHEEVGNSSAASTELVILVHGTFAGDKSAQDVGERWWQRGSRTWIWLEENLPPSVSLPEADVRLFHWSGSNAQSERLAASVRLLALLMRLEKDGRRYHLVGHSHGGSIIWESLVSAQVIVDQPTEHEISRDLWNLLESNEVVPSDGMVTVYEPPGRAYWKQRESVRRDVRGLAELVSLASWTTVGTPFLRFLPSSRFFSRGWSSAKFTLSVKPSSRRYWNWVDNISALFGISTYIIPVYVVLGLFIDELYRPDGALLVAIAVIVFTLRIITGVMDAQVELSSTVLLREDAGLRCFSRFHDRWLGLWAETDEAVLLLRNTITGPDYDYRWLCLPVKNRDPQTFGNRVPPFRVPRMKLRPSNLVIGFIPRLPYKPRLDFHTVKKVIYSAFNKLIAPRLSEVLNRTLLNSVQGNDIPGLSLAYASPWPIPVADPPSGLPEYLSNRLEQKASNSLGRAGSLLREVAVQETLDGFSRDTGNGAKLANVQPLVHTSYFENVEVLSMIASHIAGLAGVEGERPAPSTGFAHIDSWMLESRATVMRKAADSLGALSQN
ncbi:hypothetical protein ACFYRY_26850 [Streptomyces sp. NPDC005263]|uniref:hypothetical protein n=1 Tax=Streptomyces sp. NPDC005263 TaxID=3364711 RepID=UPI0036A6EEBD